MASGQRLRVGGVLSSAQDGDWSPVYDMAKAMMTIQRAYGLIPRIIGKGDGAKVSAYTGSGWRR